MYVKSKCVPMLVEESVYTKVHRLVYSLHYDLDERKQGHGGDLNTVLHVLSQRKRKALVHRHISALNKASGAFVWKGETPPPPRSGRECAHMAILPKLL